MLVIGLDLMHLKLSPLTRRKLKEALREDVGSGDLTSKVLIARRSRGKAVIRAREGGIFCGRAVARELFRRVDPRLKIKCYVRDRARFSKNKVILRVEGSVRSILAAERTVLNFLGRLSGIATLTRAFVDRVKKYRVAILDTRKTTPLWRGFEKYAVRCGGGVNHRLGLHDEIFVKDNHWKAGDLSKLRKYPRGFVIEVRNARGLSQALRLSPRVILFDNFSPAALGRAVRSARKADSRVLFEASGGVTLANVGRIAATGVDRISVGRLTHSATSIDFSLFLK